MAAEMEDPPGGDDFFTNSELDIIEKAERIFNSKLPFLYEAIIRNDQENFEKAKEKGLKGSTYPTVKKAINAAIKKEILYIPVFLNPV